MGTPEINLTNLHAAMKTAFLAAFPGVSVDYYDRPGEKLTVPAIRFELEQIAPANPYDTGTEQLEVELRFSAECVSTYKQGGKLGVRLLAAQVAKFVQGNRFSSPLSPGRFASATPETFSEEYETFRVEWSHTAFLGASIWDGAGVVPTQIFLGIAPYIGVPNEPYYRRVIPPE